MVVGSIDIGTDVLVIGAGPAGYTAAIRCAEMGLDTTLVNNYQLGGTCLHKGCIPIKTIQHSLNIAGECRRASKYGVHIKDVSFDLNEVYSWKDKVVSRLESGIRQLCQRNGVQLLEGTCTFRSSSRATVNGPSGSQGIEFNRAVIATGTHFKEIPGVPFDGERVLAPYDVLKLREVPEDIIILGSGYAGVTMGTLMAKMGTKVTIIHSKSKLLTCLDDDMLKPINDWFKEMGVRIYPNASWKVEILPDGVRVRFNSGGNEESVDAKKLIAGVGSIPNTEGLGLENTRVQVDDKGFVKVDSDLHTTDPSIYAIGDINGGLRNASRAFREGDYVARTLAGKPGLPEYQYIPFTISSEPEVASVGMSEIDVRSAGIDTLIGKISFAANGKAVSTGHATGFVKVLAERSTHRILGVHIIGPHASDIIDEALLAVEMGARLEDIILTIHPHPTLSEALQYACAMALGISDSSPG